MKFDESATRVLRKKKQYTKTIGRRWELLHSAASWPFPSRVCYGRRTESRDFPVDAPNVADYTLRITYFRKERSVFLIVQLPADRYGKTMTKDEG